MPGVPQGLLVLPGPLSGPLGSADEAVRELDAEVVSILEGEWCTTTCVCAYD